MEARYNLRSTRQEDTHISVELQLAGNGMFLSQALGSCHPQPGQVDNFQSVSTSESDSKHGVVEDLDNEQNSPVKNSRSKNLVRAGQSAGASSESRPPLVGQDQINTEILKQLSQLSDSLATIEQKDKKMKKSLNKSQIKNSKKNNNRVKWPHEFVLAGTSKERVTYDQMSTVQWMIGFCRTMRDQNYLKLREFMLAYLINLLGDANDLYWGTAKANHALLLCRVEQGKSKIELRLKKSMHRGMSLQIQLKVKNPLNF